MAKRIALFNHKGGVSKTTTTFNLGWMLASKGKTVVMVDSDPQCNLTGLVLGFKGPDAVQRFYQHEQRRNLRDGLAPAFESRPEPIEAVDCLGVPARAGLYLLPGHIRLSEYEVTLGIAQELSGSIQTLQNLPGSITVLLQKTAEKLRADYLLIDMNPSLSAFNQNLLMTSDFFVLPTAPDFFSLMAIDSLANVLPRWREWARKASSLQLLKEAVYPFPDTTPKFLGTIVQKYRPRGGVPSMGFQNWIDEITIAMRDRFVPELKKLDMLLPEGAYQQSLVAQGFCLATVPDFNTLIAKSQKCRTPVFALSSEHMEQVGIVLDRTLRARDRFQEIFSDLADRIIGLTGYAGGS